MKSENNHGTRNRTIVSAAALFIGVAVSPSAQADDEYQYRVLFAPSAADLAAEARGHVMIYDGLRYTTVTRAMDEQFERIENMMFVGTVVEQEDGELAAEEDGCD